MQACHIGHAARPGLCQDACQMIKGIGIGCAPLQQRHEWNAAVHHDQQQEEPDHPKEEEPDCPQEEDPDRPQQD
jgi:hypothetical protein